MPPANAQTPAPGQFDFMMKDQPKPPGRFSGLLASVPKPARVVLMVMAAVFVLVIAYALFFGGKTTNVDQLISSAAQAQEIARVSILVQTSSQSSDTQALAATTEASLSSQQQQFSAYLKTNGVKLDTKKLAAKLDKSTDTALTSALQNNNYDQTYYDYLKTNLAAYQSNLTAAYKGAGKKAQTILSAAYDSVQTLLSAPQLK